MLANVPFAFHVQTAVPSACAISFSPVSKRISFSTARSSSATPLARALRSSALARSSLALVTSTSATASGLTDHSFDSSSAVASRPSASGSNPSTTCRWNQRPQKSR
ncbi:hypothetical protein ACPXCX_46050, partial [Streptomyces sp. DT225]